MGLVVLFVIWGASVADAASSMPTSMPSGPSPSVLAPGAVAGVQEINHPTASSAPSVSPSLLPASTRGETSSSLPTPMAPTMQPSTSGGVPALMILGYFLESMGASLAPSQPMFQPSMSSGNAGKPAWNPVEPKSTTMGESTGTEPVDSPTAPTYQPSMSPSNAGEPTTWSPAEQTSIKMGELTREECCDPPSAPTSGMSQSSASHPTWNPAEPTTLMVGGSTGRTCCDSSAEPTSQPSMSQSNVGKPTWIPAEPTSFGMGGSTRTVLGDPSLGPTSQPSMNTLNIGKLEPLMPREWTVNVPTSAAPTSQPNVGTSKPTSLKTRECIIDVSIEASAPPTSQPSMRMNSLSVGELDSLMPNDWTGNVPTSSAQPSEPTSGNAGGSLNTLVIPTTTTGYPDVNTRDTGSPVSLKDGGWAGGAPTSQPSMGEVNSGKPESMQRGCRSRITMDSSVAPTIHASMSPSTQEAAAAPTGQPSMSLMETGKRSTMGGWISNVSVFPSAALTSQPSTSPLNAGKATPWNIGRSTSMMSLATACALPSHTQNTCFVSTFPCWKARHASNPPPAAFLPNILTPHNKRPTSSLFLGDAGIDSNGELTNEFPKPELSPGGNGGPQLIPILMYSAVPFIPSVLLSTLNDDYQVIKAQFNSASAALPANIAKDSLEYLSVSAVYNDTMQKLFVLLLSKRLALYFLATAATTYAGWRAAMSVAAIRNGSVGGPGDALDRLNEEILEGEGFLAIDSNKSTDSEGGKDAKDNGKDDLFATLVDQNPQSSNAGNVLAVALPLVLAASLGISYFAIVFPGTSGDKEGIPGTMLPEMVTASLPYLTSLPVAVLCLFFAAAEFRWALPKKSPESMVTDDSSQKIINTGNILALAYVMGAYFAKIYPTLRLGEMKLDIWPLQNGVNFALATAVSRALCPFLLPTDSPLDQSSSRKKSILTVALALVGLTLFDAISTFGTVANAASVGMDATESSMSVMETVARSRLTDMSSSEDIASPLAYLWQPGLLQIILGHDNSRVTEALGVGDVVFPSFLIAWAFAADESDAPSSVDDETDASPGILKGYPYAMASIIGYLFGSFATEIVGSFSLLGKVSGLPALVFLVPSMLSAVTMMAWSRGELSDVWVAAARDEADGGGTAE